MQGIKRRAAYVALYELIAVIITTYGLAYISGRDLAQSGLVAAITSFLAIIWNVGYNYGFEYIEAKLARAGRSLICRVIHAVGFEIGLALMVVPMLALTLKVSLLTALLTNIGIMAFFLGYTFVFNLAFDRVFGLPLSAQAGRSAAG